MPDYVGRKCVICKNDFIEDDDIVVCPDCGAPYHRECYNEKNSCIYESVHGTEKAYQFNKSEHIKAESNDKKCPRCKNENVKDANFCSKCGYIFTNSAYQNSYENLKNEIPFMFDPMGGVEPNEEFDGIIAGDLAKFVANNTPYYMNIFNRQKVHKRGKFNFSAFLLSGFWFLYRKMYKIGAILTSLTILMQLGSFFIETFYSAPILKSVLSLSNSSILADSSINDYSKIFSEIIKLSATQQLLLFCPTILDLLNFFIMIISGFIGNKIYYKHCVKSLNKLKSEKLTPDDYSNKIQKIGGTNFKIVSIMLLCFSIINLLPSIMLSIGN